MKVVNQITAVAAAAVMTAAFTGSANAEAETSGSFGLDVNSAYIFRGATVNDEVNVMPTAEVTFYGVTFGTWGNFNTDSSQFDEIDYYLGYDLPFESPVGISLGYCEYTYPTAVDDMGVGLEADREVSVTLSLSDVMLSPYLAANFGLEGPFLDEGIYLEGGVSYPIELDAVALEATAALGYEAGDNYAENGLSHLTLGLSAGVGMGTLSVSYVIETDDKVLTVDEDVVVNFGVAF
jgi:uncharacterized protein (TIGR02001 family)